MIPVTKKWEAGKPPNFSASAQNALIDAANAAEAEGILGAAARGIGKKLQPNLTAFICNASGIDAQAGYILKITGARDDFPTLPFEASRKPVFTGEVPGAITDAIAIVDEAMDYSATQPVCGRAILAGEAVCTVAISDSTHKFAVPTVGDSTKLTSAGAGPIRILAKASTSTGDVVCMVFLQSWASKDSLVYVSSNTPDAGGYPGHNYVNNGDGTWTTGVSIRVQITPNGYDELQPGDQWAERNGTVGVPRIVTDGVTTKGSTTVTSATAAFTSDDKLGTISGTGIPASTTITVIGSGTSVTMSAPATASGTGITFTITPIYPLYFEPGNVMRSIADCVDSVPGTRPWSIPGPWEIGDFVPD